MIVEWMKPRKDFFLLRSVPHRPDQKKLTSSFLKKTCEKKIRACHVKKIRQSTHVIYVNICHMLAQNSSKMPEIDSFVT